MCTELRVESNKHLSHGRGAAYKRILHMNNMFIYTYIGIHAVIIIRHIMIDGAGVQWIDGGRKSSEIVGNRYSSMARWSCFWVKLF